MDRFVESIISLTSDTYNFVEGFMKPRQAAQLIEFLNNHPEIKHIAETGFNVGMSTASMLNVRSNIKVYSFDLAEHNYVIKQKKLIDDIFPNQHALIIGDSTKTIPQFMEVIKEPIFDFVLIDGGHISPVPESDIRNLLKLLKPNGFMCVDDYNLIYGYQGVIQAVDDVIKEKLVEKLDVYETEDRTWIYLRKL